MRTWTQSAPESCFGFGLSVIFMRLHEQKIFLHIFFFTLNYKVGVNGVRMLAIVTLKSVKIISYKYSSSLESVNTA